MTGIKLAVNVDQLVQYVLATTWSANRIATIFTDAMNATITRTVNGEQMADSFANKQLEFA